MKKVQLPSQSQLQQPSQQRQPPQPYGSIGSTDLTDLDKNEIFERILKEIGGFGIFQGILWSIGLLACFVASFNHMGIIFIAYAPKTYYCIREGINTFGLDEDAANKSLTSKQEPPDPTRKPQCWNGDDPCQSWHFEDDLFSSTIVTEFNLVCDRLPLLPLIISSYMIGIVVINTLCGFLSDRFGRRRVALIFTVIHISSSFATAFSINYGMFMGLHILVGSSIHSVWSSLFILTAEAMPEPYRVVNGGVFNFGWNIGALIMSGLAYLLRDWSHLQISFAVFSIGLLSIFFLVPESPRWLLHQGRFDDAEEVLRVIAKRNRVKIESSKFETYFKILKEQTMHEMENTTYKAKNISDKVRHWISMALDLLKHPEFVKRFFLMTIVWLVIGCTSYGIHFSTKFIEYDIFATTAIKEVVVMAVIMLMIPIYQRMNSAFCILIFYSLAGLLGISFLLLSDDAMTARVILYIFCQSLMSCNFYLVDTYTPDLFSTDVRNFTFNILDAISKIGTTISPFIVDLGGDYNPNVPPAVFGIMMLVASFAFIFTPNTRGQPLVQEVEDLKWTKGRTLFDSMRRTICSKETLV